MPVDLPPHIETRPSQHCVRISVDGVRQPEIGTRLPPLLPELFGWLAARGIAPCGPPFFRYVAMSLEAGMTVDVDVGVAVPSPVEGDGRVQPDVLPQGRYAVLIHRGDFAQVYSANAALHDWLGAHRLAAAPVDGRASGGAHLEFYVTEPDAEPDVSKWVTEVAIRLQD